MKTTDNTEQETEFPVRMSIKLANYYYQCEAQRDAALAALRDLLVQYKKGTCTIDTCYCNQARAAIAATQEGAQ